MYWLIETDEAFDLSKSPSVNVGSLVDDVEQVHALVGYSQEQLQISPWHDLDHLKGILSRLSMMTRG